MNYFHGGYGVRVDPIHLRKRWQVHFTITRHDYPLPEKGKSFTCRETLDSEKKAIDRCMELADAIIDGDMEGNRILDSEPCSPAKK